jgi:hypothetical protein
MLQHDFENQPSTPEQAQATPAPKTGEPTPPPVQKETARGASAPKLPLRQLSTQMPTTNLISAILLCVVLILGGFLLYTTLKPASPQSSSTTTEALPPGGTTATPPPTATLESEPNPYASTGTLALRDPLADNTGSARWAERPNADGSGCMFQEGGYHVKAVKSGTMEWCAAQNTDFANFTYEVQMKILQGGEGGLFFRADSGSGKWYFFTVTQDGHFGLVRYDGFTTSATYLIEGVTGAVQTGASQDNVLAVKAQGSDLWLYVNHAEIFQGSDATYTHGQIGLIANGAPVEVVYSNTKVWTF